MLRLTQWIADYYLCDWGQVLETVVPAGVRGQAGTRMTTLLSLAPEGAARLAAGKLPKKQLAVLQGAGRGRAAAHARRTGPGGRLHDGAHRRAAAQRADPCPRRAAQQLAQPAAPADAAAREAPGAQSRSAEGAGRDPRRPPRAPAPDDPDPRRDRQRQDRGLHPGDPGGDRASAGRRSCWCPRSA